MNDKQIIELYFARSESAIEETAKKYAKYFLYIAKNILDSDPDAEEIVNDTYLRAWNSIPPNRPNDLKIYLGRIAKRLAINRLRDMSRDRRGGGCADAAIDELSDILSHDSGDPVDTVALRDVMNRFLASLDTRTRKIFVRRYWYAAPVSELSRDFHMKESNVTMLMLRTRKKLALFLQKEGFEL